MGFASCSHGVYEHVPHCQISQKITLLLRAPGASAEDVVEDHTAVDAVSLRDGLDSVGAESASAMCQLTALVIIETLRSRDPISSLGIDISHLASCSTLIFGKLSGNAQRVAELGLKCQLIPPSERRQEEVVKRADLARPKLSKHLGDALRIDTSTKDSIDSLGAGRDTDDVLAAFRDLGCRDEGGWL